MADILYPGWNDEPREPNTYDRINEELGKLPPSLFEGGDVEHSWTLFTWDVRLILLGPYTTDEGETINVYVSNHHRLYEYDPGARGRGRFSKIWPLWRSEKEQTALLGLLKKKTKTD